MLTPILIFGLIVFAYGLVSKRLTSTVITGPIVFTTAGLLLAFSLPVVHPLTESGIPSLWRSCSNFAESQAGTGQFQ